MDNFLINIVLFFVALIIIKGVIDSFSGKKDKLGIKGKLIWVDKGKNTKPFFNHTFQILGKPDLMYKVKGGILAVEYKSRKGRYFLSDIIQTQTAALAARANGYNVTQILVKTATTEKYIDLPKKDHDLYEKIMYFVEQARNAKKGAAVAAEPAKRKCSKCAYSESCFQKV